MIFAGAVTVPFLLQVIQLIDKILNEDCLEEMRRLYVEEKMDFAYDRGKI